MFEKPISHTTVYYVVRHNKRLFTVMSKVTAAYADGTTREFKNFVAEVYSETEAHEIADKLHNLGV